MLLLLRDACYAILCYAMLYMLFLSNNYVIHMKSSYFMLLYAHVYTVSEYPISCAINGTVGNKWVIICT